MTMTEDSGVKESLGFDELTGLKDPKGGDLDKIQIPRLPGFAALRLQHRVFKQFMKVAELGEAGEDKPLPITEVLDRVYDDEGIQLQIDVLTCAFGETEQELEKRFHFDSLLKIYAFIVQRDFNLQDIVESFVKRFSEMFGGEVEVPPPAKPPES